MRRKTEIRFKCSVCGKEPEPIKEQSNENWTVVPAECPTCKAKLEMVIGDAR